MAENNEQNNEQQEPELKRIVEESVDASVARAFKKYGRNVYASLRNVVALLLVVAVLGTGIYWVAKRNANNAVVPVDGHDLTLDNNGIFGFTVADFEEPILGVGTRQRLLIVEEQEVYVNTVITETGLFNLGIFNKQQVLTIHGMGQYTIDLTQVTANDISLNEDTYELTIRIPHAELHQTIFDPSLTEVGDANNGWLAFGTIKMTADQQKEFEVTAIKELGEKLNEAARFAQADRFAKLSAYETYQPIIEKISPAYKVVVEFQE